MAMIVAWEIYVEQQARAEYGSKEAFMYYMSNNNLRPSMLIPIKQFMRDLCEEMIAYEPK